MKCGLIGGKLGHSFSKIIHERLTDAYSYDLFPLEQQEFETFMLQKDFHALNVTIPYKISVIPYLEKMDGRASAIGAVNTVVNQNGTLLGYNTDFGGFLTLLNRNHIAIAGKKVIILGKGGASKAVRAVLEYLGANEIITVYYKENANTITYKECLAYHTDCHVIVNTTPVGMYPHHGESPMHLDSFKSLEAVVDVIYNPIASDLVVQARNQGIVGIGGLEMLVAQAHEAAGIFLGKPLDDSYIDRIYRQLLSERLNIVLIGMPSSGKTTLGKMIGETLNRPFYDTDDEIIAEIGMPISEYFACKGEEAFREVETGIIKRLSGETGVVLSTGGGCIKNSRNMDYLMQNGIILFIERPVERLLVDKGRPLSSSANAILTMYAERLPLYQKYSVATISNIGSLTEAVQAATIAFANAVQRY